MEDSPLTLQMTPPIVSYTELGASVHLGAWVAYTGVSEVPEAGNTLILVMFIQDFKKHSGNCKCSLSHPVHFTP